MLIRFAPAPDMRAVELAHMHMIEIPLAAAIFLQRDLGTAHFRSPGFAAWYGEARKFNARDAEPIRSHPFALRVDANGRCTLQVEWTARDMWDLLLLDMAEPIFIEPTRAMEPGVTHAA